MSSEGKLARVTYLPGVARQSAAVESSQTPTPEVLANRQRAENISMHALTRRACSRAEIAALLRTRDLDPDTVEFEIERLERVGLLDDHELARILVRTGHERKGLGRAGLRSELQRRQISTDVIDDALIAVDDEDEVHRATLLAHRRARQLGGLDHATAVRRLSGFLQRKGYSADTVRAAVTASLPSSPPKVSFR